MSTWPVHKTHNKANNTQRSSFLSAAVFDYSGILLCTSLFSKHQDQRSSFHKPMRMLSDLTSLNQRMREVHVLSIPMEQTGISLYSPHSLSCSYQSPNAPLNPSAQLHHRPREVSYAASGTYQVKRMSSASIGKYCEFLNFIFKVSFGAFSSLFSRKKF